MKLSDGYFVGGETDEAWIVSDATASDLGIGQDEDPS